MKRLSHQILTVCVGVYAVCICGLSMWVSERAHTVPDCIQLSEANIIDLGRYFSSL